MERKESPSQLLGQQPVPSGGDQSASGNHGFVVRLLFSGFFKRKLSQPDLFDHRHLVNELIQHVGGVIM